MDYIPLERKRKSNFNLVTVNKRLKMKSFSFGGDNRILPRIKQLMETDQFSDFVDDEQMLVNLQDTYPEYRRKKKNDLKAAIRKAVEMFSEDCNNYSSRQNSAQGIEFSPEDAYVAYEDAKCFKKMKRKAVECHQEKETISDQSAVPSKVNCTNSPVVYENQQAKQSPKSSNQLASIKSSGAEKSKKMLKNTKKQEFRADVTPRLSNIKFSDIGGMEKICEEICKIVLYLKHPEIFQTLGDSQPPCGVLLHGPPGCGKTMLARAIAAELRLPLIEVASTELVTGVSGESEEKIRSLFEQAMNSSPCILFIDEIDAITPKREFAQREMEKRIVSQLLKCMDDLNMRDDNIPQVLVIGATNRPDAIDPALRRAGRFDREICIGIPDEAARTRILQVICRPLRLSPDFDFHWLAKNTPGYVGADLMAITREAKTAAINRIFRKFLFENECKLNTQNNTFKEDDLKVSQCNRNSKDSITEMAQLQNKEVSHSLHSTLSWLNDEAPLTKEQLQDLYIEVEDFRTALDVYVPSLKREGFAAVPQVTWKDVGALKEIQETLKTRVLLPIKHRELFNKPNITTSGILLWGPKGCGKTLIAKAIANECSINFLSVRGPELLNMFVGESERAVRQVFERARNSAPCLIFFDEMDSLAPPRSSSSGNVSAERVVNQLLTELDGLGPKKQIFVLGATNRLDKIDPAILRPGRLEEIVYVGLPTPEERVDILKALTKDGTDPKIADDITLETIALDARCDGFSGADLASLVRNAYSKAVENLIANVDTVEDKIIELSLTHFESAFSKTRASVSEEENRYFNMMKLSFGEKVDSIKPFCSFCNHCVEKNSKKKII